MSDPARAIVRHVERGPAGCLTWAPLAAEFLDRRDYPPRIFLDALIEALDCGALRWSDEETIELTEAGR